MPVRGLPRTLLGVSLKMYFDHRETIDWCREVVATLDSHPALARADIQVIVLPSFPSLPGAFAALAGTPVALGAQDVSWELSGPFTGEVSATTLAQVGCTYVEVGHAERKRLFGDDSLRIAGKVSAAVRSGLVPILCVGEHDRGTTAEAVAACVRQISTTIETAGGLTTLVVAYEPEWAIGADEAASPAHIRAVADSIRGWLDGRVPEFRVIYGGSAGPGLLTSLGNSVDGLFLGRFAHDPHALRTILEEATVQASDTRRMT